MVLTEVMALMGTKRNGYLGFFGGFFFLKKMDEGFIMETEARDWVAASNRWGIFRRFMAHQSLVFSFLFSSWLFLGVIIQQHWHGAYEARD